MTVGLASDLGDQREACCNKASYNVRIVSTKLFPPCFTSSVGALFIPVGGVEWNIFPLSRLARLQFKNAAYVNPNLRGVHVASDAHREWW